MPVMHIKPGSADPVKKPAHYTYGRYEAIDVIEELTAGASGPEGFLLGNVLKYLWRYRRKNGMEDLQKAMWYLERLIQRGITPANPPTPCEKEPAGQDDDTTSATVPIRDNRPVFGETTTWAAARLTGQNGEFFDALDGKRRTRGTLIKIENGFPAPYIARLQTADRYIEAPYKFFSPLPPEPEKGRPVFNRTVAEGAARYIGKEGEFFDKLGGTRKRGVLQMITGPACDFRFNASMEGGRGIFAFFSPLNPEEPTGEGEE